MTVKRFELIFTVNEQGKGRCESTNENFCATEIVGILEWKKQDILAQMAQKITPDVVTRTVVKEQE
jgi:hypothetical protein